MSATTATGKRWVGHAGGLTWESDGETEDEPVVFDSPSAEPVTYHRYPGGTRWFDATARGLTTEPPPWSCGRQVRVTFDDTTGAEGPKTLVMVVTEVSITPPAGDDPDSAFAVELKARGDGRPLEDA